MNQTILKIYQKLCEIVRDPNQIAFILLTQKIALVGYIITKKYIVNKFYTPSMYSVFELHSMVNLLSSLQFTIK